MDEDLAIGAGLEQTAAIDQGAAERHRVGEVAVVAHGQTAKGEIGVKRLDVP